MCEIRGDEIRVGMVIERTDVLLDDPGVARVSDVVWTAPGRRAGEVRVGYRDGRLATYPKGPVPNIRMLSGGKESQPWSTLNW